VSADRRETDDAGLHRLRREQRAHDIGGAVVTVEQRARCRPIAPRLTVSPTVPQRRGNAVRRYATRSVRPPRHRCRSLPTTVRSPLLKSRGGVPRTGSIPVPGISPGRVCSHAHVADEDVRGLGIGLNSSFKG
jgi:hypothetical protein